jgi:archaemetzincin
LGQVDEVAISVVAAHLQTVMGLNVLILHRQPRPEYAYQPGRRQYDALKIINTLASTPTSVHLTLGITHVDICTPILTFVFGESQLGGRAALISLHHINDEASNMTYTRAAKIGLHEVGHLLGIGHCRSTTCVMHFSDNLNKLDQMELRFCNACDVERSRRLRHLFPPRV